MRPVYPFAAVVGQDSLKLALVLCAVDPSIGGVLVRGPRGVAKTTLSRALAELVPGRFVELPLGASEERVTGTLDLEAALGEQRVAFAPGLLALAHEGVLYVDEVNLLADPLVDLLLDAAATGQNSVERDGISHAHAARFVLVGSMNPDEGELRPQLVDRFGLSASAEGELAPAERVEIVSRRLSFEDDPVGFTLAHAATQAELVARCQRGRELVRRLPLTRDVMAYASELCHAAGVEGVRADLAMLRAARAHAAWHARAEVTLSDVDAVAELALAHRRQAPSQTNPPRGGSPSGSSGANPGTGGGLGELAPVPVKTEPVSNLAPLLTPQGEITGSRRYGKARIASKRGSAARASDTGRVDWFRTLSRTPRPSHRELVRRAPRTAPEQLWILAVDCSSSMLQGGGLARAKGVAQALEQQAKAAGASLALLSFRGGAARTELVTSAGRAAFSRALDELGAGGGTPLLAALHEVISVSRARAGGRGMSRQCVLFTDGKTREPLPPLAHALGEVGLTVVDCERGRVRLGRARGLAEALGGRYLHVDVLSGQALVENRSNGTVQSTK